MFVTICPRLGSICTCVAGTESCYGQVRLVCQIARVRPPYVIICVAVALFGAHCAGSGHSTGAHVRRWICPAPVVARFVLGVRPVCDSDVLVKRTLTVEIRMLTKLLLNNEHYLLHITAHLRKYKSLPYTEQGFFPRTCKYTWTN